MLLREFRSNPVRALPYKDRTHFTLGRPRRALAHHDGPLVGYERAHDDGRGYASGREPGVALDNGAFAVEPTP